MLLPKFEFYEPSNLQETCQVLAGLKEDARLLAGGTDLIVNMKKRLLSPANVVSLAKIPELKKMETSGDSLTFGACLTAAEIARSEAISKNWSALAAAAGSLGTPLIRNLATVGGNLVSARPAADFPLPLLAYGAKVRLKKSSGDRWVLLEDFLLGPGQTLLGPDEILTEISVDSPPPVSGAGYMKLGIRKTLEISIVNVASFLSLEDRHQTIRAARVVLGAVASTPIRALSAEKALIGEKPSDALFMKAGEAAARDCRPIDDFRASADYRRAMVEVLTRRTLAMAREEAGSRS